MTLLAIICWWVIGFKCYMLWFDNFRPWCIPINCCACCDLDSLLLYEKIAGIVYIPCLWACLGHILWLCLKLWGWKHFGLRIVAVFPCCDDAESCNRIWLDITFHPNFHPKFTYSAVIIRNCTAKYANSVRKSAAFLCLFVIFLLSLFLF